MLPFFFAANSIGIYSPSCLIVGHCQRLASLAFFFFFVVSKEHLTSHRGTKEYQCTECSSKFYTNGGLNRHSKIHVVKQ